MATKAITLEQARAKLAKPENKPQTSQGGAITVEADDKSLAIGVDLTSPYVRSGKDKQNRDWVEIVYASTVKSQFAKSIPVKLPNGTMLRLQIKVTEASVQE